MNWSQILVSFLSDNSMNCNFLLGLKSVLKGRCPFKLSASKVLFQRLITQLRKLSAVVSREAATGQK